MVTDENERTSLSLRVTTKRRLDAIKHPGQSYDGLLQELMNLWEREHPKKEDHKSTS